MVSPLCIVMLVSGKRSRVCSNIPISSQRPRGNCSPSLLNVCGRFKLVLVNKSSDCFIICFKC